MANNAIANLQTDSLTVPQTDGWRVVSNNDRIDGLDRLLKLIEPLSTDGVPGCMSPANLMPNSPMFSIKFSNYSKLNYRGNMLSFFNKSVALDNWFQTR